MHRKSRNETTQVKLEPTLNGLMFNNANTQPFCGESEGGCAYQIGKDTGFQEWSETSLAEQGLRQQHADIREEVVARVHVRLWDSPAFQLSETAFRQRRRGLAARENRPYDPKTAAGV